MNDYGCITEGARSNVDALLHQQFRPEFLNRLDEIVFYKPLQQEEILSIVDLMLDDLRHRLDAKQLRLDVTDEAKRAVVDNSYDISYGARPIRRYLQQQIETQIALYKRNALTLTSALDACGVWYTGGKNAPYIWLRCPGGMDSWAFFDFLFLVRRRAKKNQSGRWRRICRRPRGRRSGS